MFAFLIALTGVFGVVAFRRLNTTEPKSAAR